MANDPANKSAPTEKHKPSAKHTLHEVLNSLQDMLDNELAADANRDTTANSEVDSHKTPNVLHSRRRDEVLSSLKNLIGAAAAGQALPTPRPDASVPKLPPNNTSRGSKRPEKVSQAKEFDRPPEAEPASGQKYENEFHLEMEDPIAPPPSAGAETDTSPPIEKASLAPTPSRRRKRRPRQIEIGWDDIPVLNDVVEPAPTIPDLEITPAIRDIAIQVAAALNIELKRAGKDTLDVRLVMQLQSLLQRELVARGFASDDGDPNERKEE